MGAPNRNQHWVPQFYLRHFAIPGTVGTKHPKIWAFPVHEGVEFSANVRNVAAQKDLYNYCDPEVDERLTDLEGWLASGWSMLTEKHYPIDSGFKKAISLFISTLYLRHPAELERQRQHVASIAKLLESAPRNESGGTLVTKIGIGHKEYEIDAADLDKYRTMSDSDIRASWGQSILSETGYLAQALLDRPFTVLVSDEPAFITTDNPVTLFNPRRNDAPIINPDTSIYFPLSPKKLVLINYRNQNSGHIVQISKENAATFNYSIFRSAYKHVFSAWDSIDVMRQVVSFSDQLHEEERSWKNELRTGTGIKTGRNGCCPCGSGKKYKRCCGR